jgi:hypothetical protein
MADWVTAAERALLHPASWIALLVLALNDHVLKGAGMLPAWVTGKLSDFAGLFVAPIVLAVLVRARRRPSVLACYALVGVTFAALELPAVAAWLGAVAGVVLWADRSDLLALAALWPSWWMIWCAPEPALSMRFRWPVAAVALVLGAATSPAYERYVRKPGARMLATAVLSNASSKDMQVSVSLYEDPPCDALLAGDLRSIDALDIDETAYWWLEPRENIPILAALDADPQAKCYLVYVGRELFLFEKSAIPARDVLHFGAVDSGVVRLHASDHVPPVEALAPIRRVERGP